MNQCTGTVNFTDNVIIINYHKHFFLHYDLSKRVFMGQQIFIGSNLLWDNKTILSFKLHLSWTR